MKFAWIEGDKIRDIAPGEPSQFYHADVAKFYDTHVPDEANNGDGWVNGQLIKPEPPTPPEPAPRTWSADQIRSGLTLAERVKWDNDKTDTIKTAKVEFATPQGLDVTTDVLQMLVDAADISQASMNKIIA